jgi:hypothetical protein
MRTHFILRKMATVISAQGLHTGDQFAAHGPMDSLDICAIAYVVAEDTPAPDVFFTNEGASRDLIESSERAMDAIRAISAAIADYEVPESDGRPDVIEHVSQWTFTPPIGENAPPTLSQVIGCVLRAANHTANHTNAA